MTEEQALKRASMRLRKDIVLILERMLDGDEPEKHVIGFADEIIALLEAE